MRFLLHLFLLAGTVLGACLPLSAQTREVPYWASLRADEVNMRVGPSPDYRIEWVYKRKGLPVQVVRVMEGWRLVRDPEGEQGWITARLLSPERTALVVGEGLAPMRETAGPDGALRWNVEPGVVGRLGKCEAGWCQLDIAGRAGWVEAARLWGPDET